MWCCRLRRASPLPAPLNPRERIQRTLSSSSSIIGRSSPIGASSSRIGSTRNVTILGIHSNNIGSSAIGGSIRTANGRHAASYPIGSVSGQAAFADGRRSLHGVALQLDYYMSPQFAGVAAAIVDGGYRDAGLDLTVLPTCPVGLEQARVRAFQDEHVGHVAIGSVEQNVFVPTLAAEPSLRTTAVAAMFRRSPLCVASLHDLADGASIGAHEDTVALLQRIFPHQQVHVSPRASKNADLLAAKYDAIQAYTTTEVPALRRALSEAEAKDKAKASLVVTPLEGTNGAKLGYSQVLFASDESLLEGSDRRQAVQAFLQATFDGWATAIRDPQAAVAMVDEAKKMLGLDDEDNDHWHKSAEFDVEMLQLCNDHVKETFEGDRYGVIDVGRWSDATEWLMEGGGSSGSVDQVGKVCNGFGLDESIWPANSK